MLHVALPRWMHTVRAVVTVGLALLVLPGQAASLSYTLGPDGLGVGRVLTTLDGTGAPTAVHTLGDGSAAFNGLSYRASDGRFYAVTNDAAGHSGLVAFTAGDPSLITHLGDLGAGVMGLSYRASEDVFYAASTSFTGESRLLRVALDGSSTDAGALGLGFLGGLAFGSSANLLYGFSADASGVQRVLNEINLLTGAVTALFALGDGGVSFNGGFEFDSASNLFQVIGSDFMGASSLYRFGLDGVDTLSMVGDVGFGYMNASLVTVRPFDPIPEPGSLALLMAALLGAGLITLSSPLWRVLMRVATGMRVSLLAALALMAGAAQAQYSSPMRDVENPDRFPYQERATGSLPLNYLNTFLSFPTPTGKRYVIEFVSVRCTTQSANDTFPQVLVNVTKITGPNSTSGYPAMSVPMERRGSDAFSGYVWSGFANVKLYSDPSNIDANGGNGIQLNVFHTDTGVGASCMGVVSGHTITP